MWQKKLITLNKDHNYKTPEGYKIFMVEKGAIRIYIPEDWVVKPEKDCITFHDAEPPDDNCRLSFSYFKMTKVDFTSMPLKQFLLAALKKDDSKSESVTVHEMKTNEGKCLYIEQEFIDPIEKRAALSRFCIIAASPFQVMLTFDYWQDQKSNWLPIWENIILSVQFGATITNIKSGARTH